MDRRAILVSGIVQGVGFRPYRLRVGDPPAPPRLHQERQRRRAHRGRGRTPGLDRFLDELIAQPPPLARIDESPLVVPPRG